MPSYKTHSIHGEKILPEINTRVFINSDDIRSFCIGPDTLLPTDFTLFNFQHKHNVREYFYYLINYIKENNLQTNSEVMAFLYGQLDHYIVDLVMHPFIYYYTEEIDSKCKLDTHALVEMWIDDYFVNHLNDTKEQKHYYKKLKILDNELRNLINKVYNKIYKRNNEAIKYDLGLSIYNLYDSFVRKSKSLVSGVNKVIKLGDISYHIDISKLKPFMNLKKEVWLHPETGEIHKESLMEMWNRATEISLEVINDVNDYLYLDKPLNNYFLGNNISYNTGIPCEYGQSNLFIKKKLEKIKSIKK